MFLQAHALFGLYDLIVTLSKKQTRLANYRNFEYHKTSTYFKSSDIFSSSIMFFCEFVSCMSKYIPTDTCIWIEEVGREICLDVRNFKLSWVWLAKFVLFFHPKLVSSEFAIVLDS